MIWLASGFYIVDASQRGVVLQFGRFQEATEPGLRWLTENRDLGADATAWARFLATTPPASGANEAEPRPRLDLPERPR